MDTIGDMLTIIRNGYLAKKDLVSVSHSKLKELIVKKLTDLGFVEEAAVEIDNNFKKLNIKLKYHRGEPALANIKRVSRPGLRVYSQKKDLKPPLSGLGYRLISTSKGILTNKEARLKGLGGEIICEVW